LANTVNIVVVVSYVTLPLIGHIIINRSGHNKEMHRSSFKVLEDV